MDGLVLFCREGFEVEAAAEARGAASARGVEVTVHSGPGHVLLQAVDPRAAEALGRASVFDLVFARQVFRSAERLPLPGAEERVPLLAEAAWRLAQRRGLRGYAGLLVEAPDSERGRRLWPLCAALAESLERGLTERGLLGPRSPGPRLHLFLVDETTAVLGTSEAGRSSPFPMGIPRLRFPAGAPSRSALKLEEAILFFVPEGERAQRLRPGMRAVDLGASPGGWTWQLASRGLVVMAVDNGPMDRALLQTGLVEHVRADGFTWRPPRPVDWLVCDMVTAPARVAKLVGLWASRGLCREALFNLKLPSGNRLAEVRRCAGIVGRELERAGVKFSLRFKHLYHDREEATGHLRVVELPAVAPVRGSPAKAPVRRPDPSRGRRRQGQGRRGRTRPGPGTPQR